MPAPETVKQLVEHFTRNLPSYQSGKFNEAQLRLEFLNPFFESLGWGSTAGTCGSWGARVGWAAASG